MLQNNNLILDPVWQKRYKIAKFFVYFVFILSLFYGLYLVLFPSANFIFNFASPDSSKNTIISPRSSTSEIIKNGRTQEGNKFVFDATPIGDFSEAEVDFTLDKKSEILESGSISVRRSYRSFFYPEGTETGSLGNIEFPKLLSANNSVFLISQGKAWPIADAATFLSMGWSWNDVEVSSSEEIGKYEKQKLFTLKNPHPDGTIFFEKDSGAYYIIENGEKIKIRNAGDLSSELAMSPVIAEKKGLEISGKCEIQSTFGFLQKKYKCVIPIENMRNLLGNDYQFEASFDKSIKISNLSVTFKKSFNLENLKSSLSLLKSRAGANYYGK